jgi:hypothetical protein
MQETSNTHSSTSSMYITNAVHHRPLLDCPSYANKNGNNYANSLLAS